MPSLCYNGTEKDETSLNHASRACVLFRTSVSATNQTGKDFLQSLHCQLATFLSTFHLRQPHHNHLKTRLSIISTPVASRVHIYDCPFVDWCLGIREETSKWGKESCWCGVVQFALSWRSPQSQIITRRRPTAILYIISFFLRALFVSQEYISSDCNQI